MEHHLCVLLYSKYSPMSKQLMTAMESSPVNLTTTVGLNPVCIDNEEVRERILKANKIDVSSVPCVLIVYRTGGVEKYEGQGAFQWIEETVRKHMPSPPPQPVQRPPSPQPVQRPVRHKPIRKPDPEYEEECESSEDDYVPEPRRRRSRRSPPKQRRPSSRKPPQEPTKAPAQATALEDLDDPIDDQSPEQEPMQGDLPQRPPVAVRTGPGGYDMTSEFGEPQELNRDMSHHTRASTKPAVGQGNDLMAAAMAMQKEREAAEAKAPRSVGAPPNQRPI